MCSRYYNTALAESMLHLIVQNLLPSKKLFPTIKMSISVAMNIVKVLPTSSPHSLFSLPCGFVHLDSIMSEGILKDVLFL